MYVFSDEAGIFPDWSVKSRNRNNNIDIVAGVSDNNPVQ